jgi:hypothetical protein
MGYHSEVLISFTDSTESGEEIPKLLTNYFLEYPENFKLVNELLKLSPDKNTLYFYSDWTKWYSEEPDVKAFDDFFKYVEDLNIPNIDGIYLRQGEEPDDFDQSTINDGFHLGYITRHIEPADFLKELIDES